MEASAGPQATSDGAGLPEYNKRGGEMWAAEARLNVSINYSGKIPKLFLVFVIISAIL